MFTLFLFFFQRRNLSTMVVINWDVTFQFSFCTLTLTLVQLWDVTFQFNVEQHAMKLLGYILNQRQYKKKNQCGTTCNEIVRLIIFSLDDITEHSFVIYPLS